MGVRDNKDRSSWRHAMDDRAETKKWKQRITRGILYLPSHERIEIVTLDGDGDTVGGRHVAHSPEKKKMEGLVKGGSTDWRAQDR